MKMIAVFDMPDEFEKLSCVSVNDLEGDIQLYRKGKVLKEPYVARYFFSAIKHMPDKLEDCWGALNVRASDDAFEVGWNMCIDELLGDAE